jgi:hypothetical protein
MNAVLTAEAIAPMDITIGLAETSADRRRAQRLVAEQYAQLNKPPLDVDEVYREFNATEEAFARGSPGHRLSTFIAQESGQIVETMSLTWCAPSTMPHRYSQIEALRLLRPERPWPDLLGCAPHEIGELTRLAIRRDYQGSRHTEAKLRMFRSMMCMALDFAERQHVDVVLAVMPPTVTRLVAQVGVSIRQIEGVDLAHQDADCAALYRRYRRYWLPDDPRLAPKLYVIGRRAPPRGQWAW